MNVQDSQNEMKLIGVNEMKFVAKINKNPFRIQKHLPLVSYSYILASRIVESQNHSNRRLVGNCNFVANNLKLLKSESKNERIINMSS